MSKLRLQGISDNECFVSCKHLHTRIVDGFEVCTECGECLTREHFDRGLTNAQEREIFEPKKVRSRNVNPKILNVFRRLKPRIRDQDATKQKRIRLLIHKLSGLFATTKLEREQIYDRFVEICENFDVKNRIILVITLVWNKFKDRPLVKRILSDDEARKVKIKHFLQFCYDLGHGYSFSQINTCNKRYNLEPLSFYTRKVSEIERETGIKLKELCSFILYEVMNWERQEGRKNLDEIQITRILNDISGFIDRRGAFKISGGKHAPSKVASSLVTYISRYYTNIKIDREIVSDVMCISEATIRNHSQNYARLMFEDILERVIMKNIPGDLVEIVRDGCMFVSQLIARHRKNIMKRFLINNPRNDHLPRVIHDKNYQNSVQSLVSAVALELDVNYYAGTIVEYYQRYTTSKTFNNFIDEKIMNRQFGELIKDVNHEIELIIIEKVFQEENEAIIKLVCKYEENRVRQNCVLYIKNYELIFDQLKILIKEGERELIHQLIEDEYKTILDQCISDSVNQIIETTLKSHKKAEIMFTLTDLGIPSNINLKMSFNLELLPRMINNKIVEDLKEKVEKKENSWINLVLEQNSYNKQFSLNFEKRTLTPIPICTCCQTKTNLKIYDIVNLVVLPDEFYSSTLWSTRFTVLCERCRNLRLDIIKRLVNNRIMLFFHKWK